MNKAIMVRADLEGYITAWAFDKGLLKKDNAKNQILKTISELGELADAILKGDEEGIIDGIGDVEVCLTILKSQLDYNQLAPLNHAWKEIKDRTGQTVNGTFIKDAPEYDSSEGHGI